MKIILVSYYAPPAITPRAFRSGSLHRSLSNLGHDVTLISPPYGAVATVAGADINTASRYRTLFRKTCEKVLPGGKDLKHLPYFLSKLKGQEADLIISIGLPFSVHFSVAIAKCFLGLSSTKTIFDYGDPYSSNPAKNYCFYGKTIETWVLKYCDLVMTPVASAVSSFEAMVPINCKVYIVNQSYDFSDINVSRYEKNPIPTFCFAGSLFKGIREPLSFLKYLSESQVKFRFIVFTGMKSHENLSMFRKYTGELEHKLELNALIPREQCILELSKMDFLINFSNMGGVQIPSKLVDYTLASRPFLTIDSNQTDFSDFESFLNFDFSSFKSIDISSFDENIVAEKILKLAFSE